MFEKKVFSRLCGQGVKDFGTMGQAIRRRRGYGSGRCCHSSGSPFCPKPGSVGCSPSRAGGSDATSPSCLHKTPVRRPRTDFPRRRDSPAFALPVTLRRETRRASAPPLRSLVSFLLPTLRSAFLFCPLFRGPVPYAGGQAKRAVKSRCRIGTPLSACRNSRESRGTIPSTQHPPQGNAPQFL